MTPPTTCPACGEPLEAGAQFCEACGVAVPGAAVPVAGVPDPRDDVAPVSTPTKVEVRVSTAGRRPPCRECGGQVGADLYCETCGTKASSERDHFEESPAPWVAGVCDRGVVHDRNEDAMALYADGSRAVLVVCDGVSSSIDSDVASLAAARAALGILRPPLPRGMGTAESRQAAVVQTFTHAAKAAQDACVAATPADSPNPASSTFVVAVVEGGTVHHANLGDSRAYWFPDGAEGVQLTADDSMTPVLMASGLTREVAERMPQAHAITKWLGRDSESVVPTVGEHALDGPGWVVVCSDGLWNYASAPEALAAEMAAARTSEPLALAQALVAFATAQGGRDNITVALARVGDNAGSGTIIEPARGSATKEHDG